MCTIQYNTQRCLCWHLGLVRNSSVLKFYGTYKDALLLRQVSDTLIADHFSISLTIVKYGILGDLLAFLIYSPGDFYRATRIHSAHYAVARCLSVCPSVCHTPVLCLNSYIYPEFFHRRVAPPFYFSIINGMATFLRISTNISLYLGNGER